MPPPLETTQTHDAAGGQDRALRKAKGVAGPGALTGYGQARDRQASAAAGFSAHLVEPVDAEELHRVLRSLETAAGYDS